MQLSILQRNKVESMGYFILKFLIGLLVSTLIVLGLTISRNNKEK